MTVNQYLQRKFILLFLLVGGLRLGYSQSNFHETEGSLEVSSGGQAVYKVPIALPPTVQTFAPKIDLQYQSGTLAGIAGVGWSIDGTSVVSRIATRKDIDGFKDGVDFDDNDKLALDGQRLILVSGTYWADGAIYGTEMQSNIKIKQVGDKNNPHFVIYYPDGSKAFYGKYGMRQVKDSFKYYLVMRIDSNGNRIRYEYSKPYGNEWHLSEIRFGNYGRKVDEQDFSIVDPGVIVGPPIQGGTIGKPPIVDGGSPVLPFFNLKGNKIKFSYKEAERKELGYAGGNQIAKNEILSFVEVFAEDELFKKYTLAHDRDTSSGLQRVVSVTESNKAGENANPIVFEYETTPQSVVEETVRYQSAFDFEKIKLVGDFDGDERMDFITDEFVSNVGTRRKLYTKLFGNGTAPSIQLSFKPDAKALVLDKNNKLKNYESVVNIKNEHDGMVFTIYDLKSGEVLDYSKKVSFNNTYTYYPSCPCPENSCEEIRQITKKGNISYIGDFNGDGMTDAIVFTYAETGGTNAVNINRGNEGLMESDKGGTGSKLIRDPCNFDYIMEPYYYVSDSPESAFFLDLNRNVAVQNQTAGLAWINLSNDVREKMRSKRYYISDFNGDGKDDIMFVDNKTKNYIIVTFNQNEQGITSDIEVIGEGTIDGITEERQILLGDFNGDSKVDFMVPDHNGGSGQDMWTVYLANPKPSGGEFFEKQKQKITEYWPNSGNHFKTQVHVNSYFTLDVDGDGKTDLVRVWTKRFKPSMTINDIDTKWTVEVFKNELGNTHNQTGRMFVKNYESPHQHTNNDRSIALPLAFSYKHNDRDKDLIILQLSSNRSTYIEFKKDYAIDANLKRVKTNGGKIQYDITYNELTKEPNSFYYHDKNIQYPDVIIDSDKKTRLVTRLQKTVNKEVLVQDFKYHNFDVNMNFGALGFERIARSSWYKEEAEKKKWNVSIYDLSKRGVEIESYTFLNSSYLPTKLTATNSLVISHLQKVHTMQSNRGIIKINLNKEIAFDNLTKVKKEITYTYAGEYNLIDQKISRNLLNNVEQGKVIEKVVYQHVDTAAKYIVGKPKEIKTTATAYGGTFSTTKSYEYDAKGNIIVEKSKPDASPYALVTSTKLDSYGNVIEKSVSTSGGNENLTARNTSFKYDATGRYAIEEMDVEGFVTKKTYDKIYGQLTTVEDPFGRVSTFEYDNWGKLTKETDYLGATKLYSYDVDATSNSYAVSILGSDGHKSKTTTDILGRKLREEVNTIDGQNLLNYNLYDIYSRRVAEFKISATGQIAQWVEYTYDDYDRITVLEHSSGKRITNTYNGVKVTSNDEVQTTTTAVNANGHQIEKTDAGGKIVYGYNAQGLVKSYGFDGTAVQLEYDAWGRKTKLSDPSAGVYTYKYNAYGELIEENTPKGKTTLEYDAVGKLVQKKVEGDFTQHSIVNTYDATTKLIKQTSENINGKVTNFTYDYNSLLQLTKVVEQTPSITVTKLFTYDAFGRNETEEVKTNAFGKVFSNKIKNEYKNGKHWKIIDVATNKVLSEKVATDGIGNLSQVKLGNGLEHLYSYHMATSLPISMKVKKSANTSSVFELHTTFDFKRGNLLSRTSSLFGLTETFSYDELDRLTGFTNVVLGQQETQSYDNKGRITSNKIGDYEYDTTKKYQVNTIALTSDAKSYYGGRPLLEVAYNALKSPVSIHEENKEDLYFEYNGAGERTVMYYGNIATTKEQSLYQRYYSSDGSIEITYNTQNQSIDYVHYVDGDAYTATVIAKGDGKKVPQYYYFHRDYLSSIVAITDQVGNIVEKRHFDAWGTAVKIANGQGQVLNQLTFTDRGYTGHEHLQGINIIQMNGRLYDPHLRRFMAPDNYIQDPTNTQNFNRYGYVWNNPLKYTDPSGEEGISFGVAVIIGTVVAMTTYTMTALLADVPFTAGGFTKSAIFGAVSGAVSFGIGEVFQSANTVVTVQQAVAQALAHGMSQGVISVIQGGEFGSSFSSAAISSLLSAGFVKYGGSIKDNTAVMVSFSTVSGGGVSVLTGGNFWEGAATAFYVSLLNHAAHKITENGGNQDQVRRIGPKEGEKVMTSKSTWWERLWYTIEPRIYTPQNSSLRYQVDADGKVLGLAPIGGSGFLDMVGPKGIAYGMLTVAELKTLVATEKGAQSISKVNSFKQAILKGDPGIYSEAIAIYSYKGKTYILDGHHRVQAAIKANKSLEVVKFNAQKGMQKFGDLIDQIHQGLF